MLVEEEFLFQTVLMVLGAVILLIALMFFILVRYNQARIQYHRELSKAVMYCIEEERNRISKEMHDDIGGCLNLLKIQIETMQSNVNAGNKNMYLNEIQNLFNLAKNELNVVILNLGPREIEEKGLFNLLKEWSNRIEKFKSVQILLKPERNLPKLKPEFEIMVYRFMQELINNSVRFSHSNIISIEMEVKKGSLMIYYYDNGKGFNLDESISKGLGLKNIIGRVNIWDGNFNFGSRPDQGMFIEMDFDLNRVKSEIAEHSEPAKIE